MLRCFARRACLGAWRKTYTASAAHLARQTTSSGYATISPDTISSAPAATSFDPRRLPPKGADSQEWVDSVEPCLPPHLRTKSADPQEPTRDIGETASILLHAQATPTHGIDILSLLAITQGRWPAAIWLVKRLVQSYGAEALSPSPLRLTTGQWQSTRSLDDLTNVKSGFQDAFDAGEVLLDPSPEPTLLEELTTHDQERMRQNTSFAHRALGQVWRSLLNMTVVCAGGEMQPEILELIAYLHHMGIMPASIYSQKPPADVTSIQQPPTLNLLSSRILVSLSDADWRAREQSLAEETSNRRGWFAFLRPNASVSPYRVSVGGLRPEVWLELLLWSCLHGGWIRQGADFLRFLFHEESPSKWKAFSWRSHVSTGDVTTHAWDDITYAFNTTRSAGVDSANKTDRISVERTISSEVVNAFVDALASSTRVGVGERGLSPNHVIEYLGILQQFLQRSQLSLASGSWDAVILRIADTHEHYIHQSTNQFIQLVSLSPSIGGELKSRRNGVPEYIFDGNAAITGLYHRAIRSRVQDGDVRQAFELFQSLQTRADANKYRSLRDLLEQRKSSASYGANKPDLFTNNFSGISYPDFDIQLPPTISGPLLDLALDSGALTFAKWLLRGDLDEAVIPQHLYADPAVTPALIRLAGDTNDKELLQTVIAQREAQAPDDGLYFTQTYLSRFLKISLERKSWKTASRIVEQMQSDPKARFEPIDIAKLARAMLLAQRACREQTPNAQTDLEHAKNLFETVLDLITDSRKRWLLTPLATAIEQITLILLVLACADSKWTEYLKNFLARRTFYVFNLPSELFNPVLEGIARAHGSIVARQVLEIVWPHELRNLQRSGYRTNGAGAGEVLMPKTAYSLSNDKDMFRRRVCITSRPPHETVLYGGLRPDVATMRILIQAALEDFRKSGRPVDPADPLQEEKAECLKFKTTPFDMVFWAIRKLQYMNVASDDILEDLRAVLTESEIMAVQSRLIDLITIADDWNGESEDNDSISQT